jgi:hypothetical protein
VRSKSSFFHRVTAGVVTFLFLANNVCFSLDLKDHDTATITPQLVNQDTPFTAEAAGARTSIKKDAFLMGVFLDIAKNVLEKQSPRKLNAAILGELRKYLETLKTDGQTFGRSVNIDLTDGISLLDDNTVSINFTILGESGPIYKGTALVALSESIQNTAKAGTGWTVMDKYAVSIRQDEWTAPVSKDMKGKDAPETNAVVRDLIKQGSVAEVYLDKNTGTLKANTVKWIRDYTPGVVPEGAYLGASIDIEQIFTSTERAALDKWMKDNLVRGAPVRFRVVLGDMAIGWKGDADHSNIAHAGLRDRAIYIGSFLLKAALRDEKLRAEILDKDELRHIKGEDHGTPEEYAARLAMVDTLIRGSENLEIRAMVLNNDIYAMRDRISGYLKADNAKGLFELMAAVNDISLGQPDFPVESRYPIKHAVAILEKDEQEKFITMYATPDAAEYRDLIAVDDVMLMFKETGVIKDWIKKFAPELDGRTLWQISPEIWFEAGGLSRVMQYHGAGILELMKGSGAKLKHLEPQYQKRMINKQALPLDYKDKTHLTHPIVSDIEEVDRFDVMVGDKKVTAVVSRGINDMGVEVYMIRDLAADGNSYYTHSLYNYRNSWESDPTRPTWEEFSVFFSRASLEFVRRDENRERSRLLAESKEWKAPVLHLNDSQVALVAAYRRIELDQQRGMQAKNPSYEIDPVLENEIICFSTHTYGNRKDYELRNGYGSNMLGFMGIPERYREMFKHTKNDDDVYDIASAGERFSDWQGAVSRAHRDDVAMYDEWVNNPDDPGLKQYYERMGVDVNLTGVSNGDHIDNTTIYFRKYMKELFPDADVERPTADQVVATKKVAKERLSIAAGRVAYSSKGGEISNGGAFLDPGQMVISYSGRLVLEKAGRGRFSDGVTGRDLKGAFDNRNIEELLKRGAQVVIYGNVQTNNSDSDKLAEDLINFVREMSGRNYPGRLIFVPKFSLNEQRALLAASDVQVQDSDPRSEAAGFTEADVSACGGIEVGTCRKDNKGLGEGLFQAQGYPMDLDRPGYGNTMTPESEKSADAYLKVLLTLNDLYNDGRLKAYQATSVRLARILDARMTAAEYLRQFNYAVINKRNRDALWRTGEDLRIMFARRSNLWGAVMEPKDDVVGGEVYKIAHKVAEGNVGGAIETLFSGTALNSGEPKLAVVAEVFNTLLSIHTRDKKNEANFRVFARDLTRSAVEFIDDEEISGAIQLMAGQALTVLSWMDRSVPGAAKIRLTADPAKMATSDKGKSYIDFTTLPENVMLRENKENKPGFFWRGVEKIKKLGQNIIGQINILANKNRFDAADKKVVMYLMDHGFVGVPKGLLDETAGNRISTMHETFFMNDNLPGSNQTTSTGAGHFQGKDLDIKYVTAGKGIQINVKYAQRDGKYVVDHVICQEIEKGDVAFAIPGYVDYMVNLGGLRFNDFRVTLNDADVRGLDKSFPSEGLDAYKDGVNKAIGSEVSPFLGVKKGLRSFILKMRDDVTQDKVIWVPKPQAMSEAKQLKTISEIGLIAFYEKLGGVKDVEALVAEIKAAHNGALLKSSSPVTPVVSIKDKITVTDENGKKEEKAPSFGKSEGFSAYVEDNISFLSRYVKENAAPRLIRIPVEALEASSPEAAGFLAEFEKYAKGALYIELFSLTSRGEVAPEIYARHGIAKQALPEMLRAEARNRENTVTICPVFNEELSLRDTSYMQREDMQPTRTILSPVGYSYDKAGMIRSVLLGLRLSVIAKDRYRPADPFVSYTLAQYRDYCVSQGIEVKDFNLTGEDLINIATGNVNEAIRAINKLIKLLPIVPLNIEELKMIYQRAREALIRA